MIQCVCHIMAPYPGFDTNHHLPSVAYCDVLRRHILQYLCIALTATYISLSPSSRQSILCEGAPAYHSDVS